MRRTDAQVTARAWSARGASTLPLPCLLCPVGTDFLCREDWLQHLNSVHGGRQRHRNAYFSLIQLKPYIATGQEWRSIISNFSEFYARSATDWQNFMPEMRALAAGSDGLPPERRWQCRQRVACVFCARKLWLEDLYQLHLAGDACFMYNPAAVWDLLACERYAERWPLIQETGELEASCVIVSVPGTRKKPTAQEYKVLLHKRRVSLAQAAGCEPVNVCMDCKEAFEPENPWLCKYSLANDLWLGRWDSLFRNANLSHQMLLALARVVSTTIVLRPEGKMQTKSDNANSWDFLFHQSGMIGSAILFQNSDCGNALKHYPPTKINDTFAVSFIAAPSRSVDQGASSSEPHDPLVHEGLNTQQARDTRQARDVV